MLHAPTFDIERTRTADVDLPSAADEAVAELLAALRVTGSSIAKQRVLFLGAGQAALEIADRIVATMVAHGVAPAQARSACWLFDSRGLVVARRGDLAWRKRAYAHEHDLVLDFRSAVRCLKPTVIIGVAAAPGEFSREVIEEMARLNVRPIICVPSRPGAKAECSARQAHEWSGGRALYVPSSGEVFRRP